MAQAPRETGGEGAAPFVRQVVPDPKSVPDVTLLTGYLGASSEEGCERLYLSADLTNYVEIPRAAILHQASLPKEQDPHGGVTLWVKKDAALQYKMAPAAQALANYFAGAIQAGAQAAAPAGPLPATLGGPACGVTLPNVCQIVSAVCTGFPAACRTPGVDCTFRCTVFGPGCQSHFHTCAPCVTVNTCGVDCTFLGPACQSHFHTCPPCVINTPFCTQNRTPCPAASCGVDCTVVGPACQSVRVGTCFIQCNVTRFEPQCPFPTEVTCVPVCHTRQVGVCPLPQAAAIPQAVTAGGPACGLTLPNVCQIASAACTFNTCGFDCTLAPICRTQHGTCNCTGHRTPCPAVSCGVDCTVFGPACQSHFHTCPPCVINTPFCTQNRTPCPGVSCGIDCTVVGPACQSVQVGTCFLQCNPTRFEFSCNPVCHVTSPIVCQIVTNAVNCPVASGVNCPQASLGCPQQSLGCGGFPGQPGFGGQAAQADTAFFFGPCQHTNVTRCCLM